MLYMAKEIGYPQGKANELFNSARLLLTIMALITVSAEELMACLKNY